MPLPARLPLRCHPVRRLVRFWFPRCTLVGASHSRRICFYCMLLYLNFLGRGTTLIVSNAEQRSAQPCSELLATEPQRHEECCTTNGQLAVGGKDGLPKLHRAFVPFEARIADFEGERPLNKSAGCFTRLPGPKTPHRLKFGPGAAACCGSGSDPPLPRFPRAAPR